MESHDVNNTDLERQSTVDTLDLENDDSPPLEPRISRLESLTRRSTYNFRHPLSKEKTGEKCLVTFDGSSDFYNPHNWPYRKKVLTTIIWGVLAGCYVFSLAAYAVGTKQISKEFNVSHEDATLGLSLAFLGFGIGPLVFAPLSESYGRKPVVIVPYFVSALFLFATGSAKDFQTIIICRFFFGLMGSCTVTNSGGVISDIWSPVQRGTYLVLYSIAIICGPSFSPIIGNLILNGSHTWRWVSYTCGILMLVILLLIVIVAEETYGPVLLTKKARILRVETGNWSLHSKQEEYVASYKEMAERFLKHPILICITPIGFFMSLYASFVFGLLYLLIEAFPIIYQEQRGLGPVVGSLPFIAYFLGALGGAAANLANSNYYAKRMKANDGKPVPEARLPAMQVGSVVFCAGLFILGWTSAKKYPIEISCVGCVLIGFGVLSIFQSSLNYMVDVFSKHAASAVAAVNFLRSITACVFPLVTGAMFRNLGIPMACSVLGIIAACLIPVPFLFFFFGSRIRKIGSYTSKQS